MRTISLIATVLFVVALPVALVTTNIRILLSEPQFYERGFRKYDAELATGVALPELDRAADEMVDYFFNDERMLTITVDDQGQQVPLFNDRERRHMIDVKNVVEVMLAVNNIALLYVGAYIITAVVWSRERSVRGLAWRTLAGVGTGLAAGGAVAGIAVVGGFDAAWTQFHEIFFADGTWQFDTANDRLIQMFPEAFWEEASTFLLIMCAAEAAVLVIVSTVYLLRRRNHQPGEPGPEMFDDQPNRVPDEPGVDLATLPQQDAP